MSDSAEDLVSVYEAKSISEASIVAGLLRSHGIEAVIDGETARPLKLKAEQVQTIKAKRRVTLRLSNGGAVNIVVNGIDRGVPGDLGKPLKVDLP